jgi:hypothetical protein
LTSDAEDLQTIKVQRLLVLERAYRLAGGESGHEFSRKEIEEDPGPALSPEAVESAVSFLDAEGLLRVVAFGGVLALTHEGVKEYERATTHPDRPTTYFPPISIVRNVLHVERLKSKPGRLP